MDRSDLPIGVFDSGVGGISVLRELRKLMPNENYIFYGDSINAPYGTKDTETVLHLTCQDAEHLLKQGVKALVVACNTATSAGITTLRQKYKNIPVIGIEPALKPAIEQNPGHSAHPKIIVMATPMTLREEKFQQMMYLYEFHADIFPLPCPGLMEFVEHGEFDGENITNLLERLFAPYQNSEIDGVVLGCTHYPFVKRAIQKVIGEQIPLFDGGAGTARETKRRLKQCDLCNKSAEIGTVVIQNSMQDTFIINLCRQLLER